MLALWASLTGATLVEALDHLADEMIHLGLLPGADTRNLIGALRNDVPEPGTFGAPWGGRFCNGFNLERRFVVRFGSGDGWSGHGCTIRPTAAFYMKKSGRRRKLQLDTR